MVQLKMSYMMADFKQFPGHGLDDEGALKSTL